MRKSFCLMAAFVILACCTGCDTYEMFDAYPWDRADHWYCEAIDFELCFVDSKTGQSTTQPGTLQWNGNVYTVSVSFHASYFSIDIDNCDNAIEMNEHLLSGDWRYCDGNLVFEIAEDNIFSGAFAELVFTPQ